MKCLPQELVIAGRHPQAVRDNIAKAAQEGYLMLRAVARQRAGRRVVLAEGRLRLRCLVHSRFVPTKQLSVPILAEWPVSQAASSVV